MADFPPEPRRSFEENLALARAGSRPAFDRLVMPYRVALRRLARQQLERRLQAKVSDSDMFQIVSLQAFENLSQFRGNTHEEFRCWLLGIMDHTVAGQNRMYHRPGRDISREVSLETIRDRLMIRQAETEDDESRQRLKAGSTNCPRYAER